MKHEYPRIVAMFPGIIAIARNEADYKRLRRNDMIGVCVYMAVLLAVGGYIAWQMFSTAGGTQG